LIDLTKKNIANKKRKIAPKRIAERRGNRGNSQRKEQRITEIEGEEK
jgi:hypothetical protein